MKTTRSRFGPGKVLISLSAVVAGIGPFWFDWNETHIHNPQWPPHAKFHNGQTMSMGASLSLVTLAALWRRSSTPRASLDQAAVTASLYWLTQLSAGLYPGAAASDPPVPAGQGQLRFSLPLLTAVGLGYLLERRRLGTG